MKLPSALLGAALFLPLTGAFDYEILEAGSISIGDVETSISPIKTIFTDEEISVSVDGLAWNFTGSTTGTSTLTYELIVDGTSVGTGTMDLSDVNRELPTSLDVGTFTVSSRGRTTVEVTLTVDDSSATTDDSFETFGAGVTIFPLIVVLLLAVTTHMVELSLLCGIFVGACMIAGEVNSGFKATLDTYILLALADEGHGFVYLFTLFLSGMVGMMEKSGGMHGFTETISKVATTPRTGQFATFLIGCFIFFDDYANVLLAGETMRPLTDLLTISREKLSFVVDATSAPIASLTPLSSWVGFEVGLIQDEIDRLIELEGEENLTIDTSGLGVFLQSIKYRYYPLFMICMVAMLIYTKRDFGPMLIAERKAQVYERTDGGDGALGHADEDGTSKKPNQPREDQPLAWWNMVFPVFFLIFFIFYLLIKSGDDGSGDQTFIDKLQGSDSYVALLWGTMAAAILAVIFYMLQIVQDGNFVMPTPAVFTSLFCGSADDPSRPRFLMDVGENIESFLHGMGRIFPALVVLTLAWAAGSVMTDVGVDRLFSRLIVGGISYKSLPTLSFVISGFMALATGTSWGTMAIIFPLIMVPTYQASNGDTEIFYATVAGVLSGAVAGDHVSPISDTTVLSALACDVKLLQHVSTQAPYAIVVSLIAILFGTVPIGRGAWPNIIGILLGFLITGVFVMFLCKPVLSDTGAYDIFFELWLKYKGEESELANLKRDCIAYCNGETVTKELDPTEKPLKQEEDSVEKDEDDDMNEVTDTQVEDA